MPKIKANGITINYDQQGTGDPLILIPYLAADHACYALLLIFEGCAHAPIYEKVEEFNQKTLAFLQRHAA